MSKIILVAGATGNLGSRIVRALIQGGAKVSVLVRNSTSQDKINQLEKSGVVVFKTDYSDVHDLKNACLGVHCVVSALAGLEDVIIEAQKKLLEAAVAAGVPRFIPSDYSLDFTKFMDGENRNLDLRRKFHIDLDKAPIEATSIFNGAFADMLSGEMPLILFKQKMILCWGDPKHKMVFTTIEDTAKYTAKVAVDSQTPRFLRIAGDYKSPSEIRDIVSSVSGEKFRIFRPGGSFLLSIIIKIARIFAPGKGELYPAWQGMQYMHNMIDSRSNISLFDNNRYPDLKWTNIEELLRQFVVK